jgi:hypothetical protein
MHPRRAIIRNKPQPPPPTNKQTAAWKAHLTRAQEALKRWSRRLKRAMTEVTKNQKKIERYQKKLEVQ